MRQSTAISWLAAFGLCLTACNGNTSSVSTAATKTAPPQAGTSTPVDRAGAASPTPASAATCTHFVAPDGDDARSGAFDAAWATMQHAADAAQPGDVICFSGGGSYITYETHFTRSGEPGKPITFIGSLSSPPYPLLVNAQDNAVSLLNLDPGVSYLRISGFGLQGFAIWGISLAGGNHDIQLDHLDVAGGEGGVHFTIGESGSDPLYGPVERVTLSDSVIRDVLYTAVDCTPGPCSDMTFARLEITGAGMSAGEPSFGADGLAIERGNNITITDSSIHDNGGDGIDLNSRDRAGGSAGILVARNRVYRNRLQGIKLWGGGRMENNAVWGQGINPVIIGVYPGRYEVVNNTIAYNMWDASYSARDYAFVAAYPEGEQPSPRITLILANNIFAFNTGPDVGTPTGIYLGAGAELEADVSNLYFSRDDCEIEAHFALSPEDGCYTRADIEGRRWARDGIQGSQYHILLDPLFVSGWPDVDLHLAAGSPAIDRGVWEGAPQEDIEGRPRTSPDIGAYER